MLKRLAVMAFILLSPFSAHAGEIRLTAAASLREAVDEICARYAQAHAGITFLTYYGGSGVLAKQIENGAPADIFISANGEWLDYLKGKNRLDARGVTLFAYNVLVFVGRGERTALGMGDLTALARIAIGSPKSVPAGEYAMAALRKAGIAAQLDKKLVPARDVRDALMYAERGEVDGAFVYRTDALQGKRVKILFSVPPGLYRRISYPMALTVAGARNGQAAAFYRYLRSGEARTTLAKYGFESIGRNGTPEGMVVAKAPAALTYRRLTNKMGLTEAQNAKLRTAFFDMAEEASRSCVVYPDRTTYLALAEKYPSLVPAVMTLAIKIGKVEADEAEEK